MAKLMDLPTEILDAILAQCDQDGEVVRNWRSVSRKFAKSANRFYEWPKDQTQVDVLMTRCGLTRLLQLTNNPEFLENIETIRFAHHQITELLLIETIKDEPRFNFNASQKFTLSRYLIAEQQTDDASRYAVTLYENIFRNLEKAGQLKCVALGCRFDERKSRATTTLGFLEIASRLEFTDVQKDQYLCSLKSSSNPWALRGTLSHPIEALNRCGFSKSIIHFQINFPQIPTAWYNEPPRQDLATHIYGPLGRSWLQKVVLLHSKQDHPLALNVEWLQGCLAAMSQAHLQDLTFEGCKKQSKDCTTCNALIQEASTFTFPRIKEPSLANLSVEAKHIVTLLDNHKNQLVEVNLDNIKLTSGSWTAVFQALRTFSKLNSISLRNLFEESSNTTKDSTQFPKGFHNLHISGPIVQYLGGLMGGGYSETELKPLRWWSTAARVWVNKFAGTNDDFVINSDDDSDDDFGDDIEFSDNVEGLGGRRGASSHV